MKMAQPPSSANDLSTQVPVPPTHQGGRTTTPTIKSEPTPTLESTEVKRSPEPDESLETRQADENGSGESDISPFLEGYKLYSVIAGLMLVCFLESLNGTFVATASPRITTDFHPIEEIGWYGSAYLVANCAVQPLAGKICSLYSLKYFFLSFLAVFKLRSLLCATANGSTMFIVARAKAGLGGAGLINGCLNTLSAVAPLERRPTLVALIFSIGNIGSIMGPIIGGALTESLTWRLCFYLNLPLGAINGLLQLLIFSPAGVQPHNGDRSIQAVLRQLDLLGFVTFALAVVMCLIALEWRGTTYPWSSPIVIGLFCGSLAVFLGFMVGQYYKGDAAMIPFGMLSRRVVYCGFLTVILRFGGLYVLAYYAPVWFQIVKGATPLLSGVYILPTLISQVIGAVISGMLVTRLGFNLPWAVLGCILTSIGSGLMSTYTPYTNPGQWIGFQILVGSGRGMAVQQPVTAVQTVMPAKEVAQATALIMFTNSFGGALFVSFGKTILLNRLIPALQSFSLTLDAQNLLDAGATG